MDVLDLYERGSTWSASKMSAAADQLDSPTPCDEWDVRALINHMLDAQQWFAEVPQGSDSPGPAATPPDLLGGDPVAHYERARQSVLDAYRDPGVREKHGLMLGICFVDQLLHGWDLAQATGQDTAIPADLADASFKMIGGRMADDQRGGKFKPAIAVPDDASPQEKLLGYGGRAAR
ncbi:MAG: TIGR03086 family protein [Actinobacteria bacterium]|nr:TIGR03086 family protein [Actinomycetota bacterium]